MLVISRKLGEEIVIGDGIRISVLRKQGSRVRLGIIAPSAVHITRKEILGTDASRILPDAQTQQQDCHSQNPKGSNDVRNNIPLV